MKLVLIGLITSAALAVSGCSTLRGAGIGAAAGAGTAVVTDNDVGKGAAIGGAAGAVVGTVVD